MYNKSRFIYNKCISRIYKFLEIQGKIFRTWSFALKNLNWQIKCHHYLSLFSFFLSIPSEENSSHKFSVETFCTIIYDKKYCHNNQTSANWTLLLTHSVHKKVTDFWYRKNGMH